MRAHLNKSAKLAAELSDAAIAALRTAYFDGNRWILTAPEAVVAAELIAFSLARASHREVCVTISGMAVRTILVRPGYCHAAMST